MKEGETSKPRTRAYRPGDLTPEERKEQLLRVDHAGEYGARRIYEASWPSWRLKGAHSASHARAGSRHLRTFEKMPERRCTTLLQPVCTSPASFWEPLPR